MKRRRKNDKNESEFGESFYESIHPDMINPAITQVRLTDPNFSGLEICDPK
jgi:hypothetical protein